MKFAPFAYVRPATVDDALAELAAPGDGKVLAGGQSLVPVLAMRLGRPDRLVDINGVAGLDSLERRGPVLRVGATVRQRQVERSAVAADVPLLGMALPYVGHRELRTRGTICGSLAHADPAAELPAVATCLGATLEVTGPSGRRRVSAADFFQGALTTAVGTDEILTAVEFPVAGTGEGFGFAEIARRHGDFALAGVVARVRTDVDGVRAAVLSGFGISDRPVGRDVTELVRSAAVEPDIEASLRAATGALAADMVDTAGDGHASTGYRRQLFAVLAARELAWALRRSSEHLRGAQRYVSTTGRSVPRKAPPSAVRATAEQLLGISCTVNGTPAAIRVPARVHLADALRTQLGLTGTHLGCEHGVCGMCTVLVDGEAARACLMLAVQAEGTEIVTVEGLGTPDDQHPLQQAFSHHHALQCGFCTPGFLLSAYDLLSHRPGALDSETLSEELSGVLCRCTGYRGILAAVADVGRTYPDGLPAARNCVSRAVALSAGSVPATYHVSPGEIDAAVPTITRPAGSPTVTVAVTRRLTSPIQDVWAVMTDARRLASCLPGAELTADLGGDHYRGRVKVALGPVRLAFEGFAAITERDSEQHRLTVLAQGADTGGNRTTADIALRASPLSDGGSELRAEAAVFLSGRIAQFGRALAGDVSQRLFEQFAGAVEETVRTGAPPDLGRAPGALAVGAAALRDAIRRRLAALRTGAGERLGRRRHGQRR